MSWEQKEIYHLEADDEASVFVEVASENGEHCRGVVTDLVAEGVGVRFFKPDVPSLSVGEEIGIALSAAALKTRAVTQAQVVHRGDHRETIEYGLHFLDQEYVHSQLFELKGLFNRRNAYRVKPTLSLPIKAHVCLPGDKGTQKVWVHNISISGIGVVAPTDYERNHTPGENVTVFVQLPDGKDPFPLTVDIRYRHLAEDHVVYGMEFDTLKTDDYAKVQDRIAAYVMQAQREELTRSRNR